jgi:hypothetical protein
MGQLREEVEKYITSTYLVFPSPDQDLYEFKVRGTGIIEISIKVIIEEGTFSVYSISPVEIPKGKRTDIVDYLMLVNSCLWLGHFESTQDMAGRSDVECVTTFIAPQNHPVTSLLIKPVFDLNILAMDAFLPGIMAILYSKKLPREAEEEQDAIYTEQVVKWWDALERGETFEYAHRI